MLIHKLLNKKISLECFFIFTEIFEIGNECFYYTCVFQNIKPKSTLFYLLIVQKNLIFRQINLLAS